MAGLLSFRKCHRNRKQKDFAIECKDFVATIFGIKVDFLEMRYYTI